ncbi:extracellular solute-binding protein [bacterium]
MKSAAGAAAGTVAALSPFSVWAAPGPGSKFELKLRQDLIYDGMFDMALRSFNSKNKKVSVKSSYVDSDILGWGHERDTALEVPSWYTEGEKCEIFLGRGPALAQLADAGIIAPLDELIDSSERLSRDDYHRSVYGSVLDSATYRGKLWGIPLIGDTYSLFCNTDLFKAAGVEKPPVTWKETIEKAGRLTRDTDGDGEPDVFGYSQCSFQFPLQIITSGIDFVDMENKRCLFDTDEGLDALETYRSTKQYSPPHVNFEYGDMGMKVSVLTNAFGKYKDINHIITRLPEGRRRANTYGDSDGIVAFALAAGLDEDTKYAAWKVIEYLTSERMYFKIVEMARMLPLRNSIREGEKYTAYRKKFPQVESFLEEMEWAVPKPCIPEYRFIEVVMREILLPVQREGGDKLTSTQLREHLKEQAERVNEKLRKSVW